MPSSSSAATRPCICTLPSVGVVVPVTIFSNVLLPAPLRPMMPSACPCGTRKSRPRKIHSSSWRGAALGRSHSAKRLQRDG